MIQYINSTFSSLVNIFHLRASDTRKVTVIVQWMKILIPIPRQPLKHGISWLIQCSFIQSGGIYFPGLLIMLMLCLNPPDQLPHYYANQNEAIYFTHHPMETQRLLLSIMKYAEWNTEMFRLVVRKLEKRWLRCWQRLLLQICIQIANIFNQIRIIHELCLGACK